MVQYQFGVSLTYHLEVIMLQDCINIDEIWTLNSKTSQKF